ncbi:zinc transporter ZIP1-like [Centruroides vittatus]|uniref:zinc transporter ZIP1-like n=1 Tax=Centruroides vittatus TaxID=120091 RepID=UPI00350ED4CC
MNKETVTKVIALFSLFGVTFLFCMLPLLLTRIAKKQANKGKRKFCERILSCLNCAGGGVFLATCLLHLFPEAKEQMEDVLLAMNFKTEFPLCEFVMAFGFLLVLATEQIVLAWKKPKKDPEGRPHSDSLRTISYSMSVEGTSIEIPNQPPNPSKTTRFDPNRSPKDNQQDDHNHGHSHLPDSTAQSAIASFLLVLALSMHSVFEGLAIGLQDSVENIIGVLVAVLMHKCIIAFTLGLNLVQCQFKWTTVIVSTLIFAIMSPLGISIAIIVTSAAKGLGVNLASGVLQSLAAGTFLYVTFFEVLPHELNTNRDRILKLLCIIIGYSIMTLMIYFMPA